MSNPTSATGLSSHEPQGDRRFATAVALPSPWGAATHRGADEASGLLKRLFRSFDGSVALRLWNGATLSLGKTGKHEPNPRFTLVCHHPGVVRSMVLGRDPLCLVEAYFRGHLDVEGDFFAALTGYPDAVTALRSVGSLAGKVVVDITNPLTADYMGLTLGHDTSAAEEIAKAIPDALVVKAFNTLFAQVLAAGADFGNGQKASVFVAGDSERARQTVRALAESMGFATIDAGGLKNARYLEPLAGLNVYLGYGAGLGTSIAPTWIHKA